MQTLPEDQTFLLRQDQHGQDARATHGRDAHATNHLDLLMELQPGGPLASWRLAGRPDDLDHALRLQAEPQPDHRREYLTYEGPVSGGRGVVQRVDAGTVTLLSQSPDHVEFTLTGQRLQGQFTLRRTETGWKLRRGSLVSTTA